MQYLERRVPFARAIALLGACAFLLAFAASSAIHVDRSAATGGCNGSGCLPVGDYTLDTSFNCGVILNDSCWANGTTNVANAVYHHFGWGSASYSGSGNATVTMSAETSGGSPVFGGNGTNLVRACYYASCVPQTVLNLRFGVGTSVTAHTIWGHAKA